MASTSGLQIDDVLTSLKPWGKWQLRQLVSQLLLCFPGSYLMLSFIIVAVYPEVTCTDYRMNASSSYTFENSTVGSFDYAGKSARLRPYFNQSLDGKAELVREDHCTFLNSSSGETTSCTKGYSYNIPRDSSITSEWDLVCSRKYLSGLSQTMFTVGQAVGTVMSMYLADRYGRKKVCLLNLWVSMALSAAMSLSPSITVYIILRSVTGFFQTGFIMVVGVIILEILPVKQRTYLALFGNLSWALAMTTFSGLGYLCRNLSWRYTQLVITAPCVFVILNMLVLDESVRWLLANGRYDSIKRIIQKAAVINGRQDHPSVKSCVAWCEQQSEKARGTSSAELSSVLKKIDGSGVPEDTEQFIEYEGNEMKSAENAAKYSPATLVRHPRLRRLLTILCCVWLMNGWVYLGLLLTSSALAGDIYMNLFLNTVIEIPGGIITYVCLRWIGRRFTCVLFNGMAALGLAISCAIQIASGSSGGTVITAFSILGKFGNSVAFGALFTYTPELYPTNLRSLGHGMAGTAARVGGMLAPFSMILIKTIPWLPSLLYSVSSLICSLLILLLPETRDKSLPQTIEDIEGWYKKQPSQHQESVAKKSFKVKV